MVLGSPGGARRGRGRSRGRGTSGGARCRLAVPAMLLAVAAGVPAVAAAGRPGTRPAATPSPRPSDPLAAELQDALRRKAAIDAAKQALGGEVQAAHDQQESMASLVVANRRAIAETIAQIAAAEQAFHDALAHEAAARARQAAAEGQAAADRVLVAAFVRTRYVSAERFIEYLVSSESFDELLSRAVILSHLTDRGTDLLRQLRADIAAASAAAAAAAAGAAAAQQAAAALATQEQQLRAQMAHEQALIASLGSGIDAANAEIAAADAQDAALAQGIAELRIQQIDQTILAAEQAAWDEAAYYYQHHIFGVPGASPTAPGQRRLVWPVPGSVISQYWGPCSYPFEPPYFGYPHFHTGIDLAAPLGHPVYAAAAGVVVAASASTEGYGDHVVIAHDSHTFTLYGHLESFAVHPGDQVRQGELIGLLGSTGNSTGPHTHFEVRIDGVPADPGPLLPPLPDGASGPPP
jgi:murein DD-endopeptidase MepM/ murein hydrolase activator NlpD